MARWLVWCGQPTGLRHSSGRSKSWPQSLITLVEHCLDSRFPSVIWWGPELIQIYNDGYRLILGAKHPKALGQSARECWAEMWHLISPLIASVFETGKAVWVEDSEFSVRRSGFLEEAYFTFSYSRFVTKEAASLESPRLSPK